MANKATAIITLMIVCVTAGLSCIMFTISVASASVNEVASSLKPIIKPAADTGKKTAAEPAGKSNTKTSLKPAGNSNNAPVKDLKEGKYVDILNDLNYSQGFNVRGLSPVKDGTAVKAVFDYGKSGLKPIWIIGQWSSKFSLADDAVLSEPKEGVYRYSNKNKVITVDTRSGEIALKALASQCYEKPRKDGEGWMHLLLEQVLALRDKEFKELNKIDNMKELRLKMKVKLSYFKDMMNGQANPGKHAAQFTMFLSISDLNNKEKGYGDAIWFGVPIFDNRQEFTDVYAARDTGQPGASNKFIYSMSSRTYMKTSFIKSGKVMSGDGNAWITIDVDLLPHIKKAYELAKKRNYLKNTSFSELYTSGMNIGWELPGTYDVEMKIKELSLKALKKDSIIN